MPETQNMTRDELLELAIADAMGVLDEVDSARFERAFVAAAPSVQAEVRAMQDRVVADRALLSDELPPASLRLKTLARVASAIEEERAAAAPIATIGPARAARGGEAAQADLQREQLVREIIERSAHERRPTQHLWRAAALFLFAALAVALYFQMEQRRVSNRLMDLVDGKLVDDSMHAIARTTEGFDFARARELRVLDADGRDEKLVHAYLDESSNRICVVAFGVAESGSPVRVVAGDRKEPVPVVASIVESRGFGVIFDLPSERAALGLEIGGRALTIVV
ncbi:MAG: hypothetical protein ACOYMM_11365 [Phycisphaerales bacterium]